MSLYVEKDKPFKICQLTDIHLGEYPLQAADLKTLAGIKQVLKQNQFDLIIITGDLIWGKLNKEPLKSIDELYKVLNEFDIPVAITYVNHDTEGMYSRKYLRDFESKLKHLAELNHEYITAERENYTLEVRERETEKLINILYVWDSGDYSEWPEISQYAAIDRHQINWYIETSNKYKEKTFDLGFMHIPVPEYLKVKKNKCD